MLPAIISALRENAKWARHPELRVLPFALHYYTGKTGFAEQDYLVTRTKTTEGHDGKHDTTVREGVCIHQHPPGGDRGTTPAAAAGAESNDDEYVRLTAKYIAGHFGSFVASTEFDRDPVFSGWTQDKRDTVREIVRAHPSVSAAELAGIDAQLKFTHPSLPELATPNAAYILINFLMTACVLQFFALLIFRATPGQRLFGFAVVNRDGAPAGRLRLLGRWFVAWMPLFIVCFAPELVSGILSVLHIPTSLEAWTSIHWDSGFQVTSQLKYHSSSSWPRVFEIVKAAAWVLWLGGFIAAIFTPPRGPHDRLAGTRLVPR